MANSPNLVHYGTYFIVTDINIYRKVLNVISVTNICGSLNIPSAQQDLQSHIIHNVGLLKLNMFYYFHKLSLV